MKLDRPGDVFADLPLFKNLEWQTDTNKVWLSICLRVDLRQTGRRSDKFHANTERQNFAATANSVL